MKKKDVREPDEKKIASLVRQLLVELGEDPGRDGLQKTPARVAKSLAFLTRGYRQTPRGVLNNAIFETGANHMIVLRGIEVYSMCEHHLLPFYGTCAVGYIARGKVLGVSKIARIVDCFARRLQIQERMTAQIADAIMDVLDARGVYVMCEATHFCMTSRGIRKQSASMVTSAIRGEFEKKESLRMEFLAAVTGSITRK